MIQGQNLGWVWGQRFQKPETAVENETREFLKCTIIRQSYKFNDAACFKTKCS